MIVITIWGRQSSSNVQAVMWCVAELHLPHKRIDAGFTYGLVNSPSYLAMNPNGTVPTIQDDEQTPLFETGAIVRYHGSVYGHETFWPKTIDARAQVDQWSEWAKLNIAGKFTSPIFWEVVRTPENRQNASQIAKAVNEFEKKLRIANSQLENRAFLASEHFTAADIQFGHVLFRYFDIAIERVNLPAISEYYERLTQRPAFKTHVMVSYEELRNTF